MKKTLIIALGLFVLLPAQQVSATTYNFNAKKSAPQAVKTVRAAPEASKSEMKPEVKPEPMGDKIMLFETTQGNFECRLFTAEAPKACENLTRLAEQGYYNGTVFHRVIQGFMIQGGDPTASGRGGQSVWGEPFEDEVGSGLSFSKPGILAMANAGPRTNGSQFFVTVAPTPHLNGKHTIFGEITSGYDVVDKISKTGVDANDRPVADQKILKLSLKK